MGTLGSFWAEALIDQKLHLAFRDAKPADRR